MSVPSPVTLNISCSVVVSIASRTLLSIRCDNLSPHPASAERRLIVQFSAMAWGISCQTEISVAMAAEGMGCLDAGCCCVGGVWAEVALWGRRECLAALLVCGPSCLRVAALRGNRAPMGVGGERWHPVQALPEWGVAVGFGLSRVPLSSRGERLRYVLVQPLGECFALWRVDGGIVVGLGIFGKG